MLSRKHLPSSHSKSGSARWLVGVGTVGVSAVVIVDDDVVALKFEFDIDIA